MNAARNGKIEVIYLLADAGIDLNVKDEKGRTALMQAVEFRQGQSVKTLLSCGVVPLTDFVDR